MPNSKYLADVLRCMDSRIIENMLIHSGDGIMITDHDNIIIWANETLVEMFGYTLEEVLGKNPSMFASGHHDSTFYECMYETLNTVGVWSGELVDRKKDGNLLYAHTTITAIKQDMNDDGPATFYTAMVRDNTSTKQYQEQLQRLAFRDPLTEVYNRRYLFEQLEHQFASAKRTGNPYVALVFDLDNFSGINNSYGHEVGDDLLVQFTNRLKGMFKRDTDIIARLGGDEFVVLLTAMEKMPAKDFAARCKLICEVLLERLNEPYILNGEDHKVLSSIGVALFNEDKDNTCDNILNRADSAMYVAKRGGKNNYHIIYD